MRLTSLPKQRPSSLWPKAIIAYFSIVIVGIVFFVTWAVRQNMDLVRKDYYAEEIGFQNHLDRMNHAQELKGKTQIAFDGVQNAVTVSLPKSTASIAGFVQFYRPSDAALDRTEKLSLNTVGVQQIDARDLPNGLWKVRVTWSAGGEDFFAEETIVIARSRS